MLAHSFPECVKNCGVRHTWFSTLYPRGRSVFQHGDAVRCNLAHSVRMVGYSYLGITSRLPVTRP